MGDAWDRLYTPHRMAYLQGEGRPATGSGDACPFCEAPGLPADDGLVVHRGRQVYVVLNLYPYNAGHLLVCPYRHVAEYTDLSDAEVAEVASVTQQAMRVIRAVSGAHGFNIGMNQGAVSGAGIAGHLHQHVVPRWGGDSNFMPIIGGTKVIPQLLNVCGDLLAAAWEAE
jgi:ATP adenylyltransferase